MLSNIIWMCDCCWCSISPKSWASHFDDFQEIVAEKEKQFNKIDLRRNIQYVWIRFTAQTQWRTPNSQMNGNTVRQSADRSTRSIPMKDINNCYDCHIEYSTYMCLSGNQTQSKWQKKKSLIFEWKEEKKNQNKIN